MKRVFALLLVITLVLCGCKGSVEETVPLTEPTPTLPQNPTEPMPEPTETVPETIPHVYEQQPMVAASMPVITQHTTSEEGNTIFTYTHQNLHLTVQDQQVADYIIIDYLNRLDAYHATAEAISQLAASRYTDGTGWNPYFCEYLFEPTRVDHSVLSLFGSNIIYTGGNHPDHECLAANYSMVTGDVLTLGSILKNADAIEPLCTLAIAHAEKIAQSMNLYSDYADIIQQRFSRDESFDEDWYFTEAGLCFYFAPYEIAPYISGVVSVEIPYEELTGILSDDYFPAEEDLSMGSVQAQLLSEVHLDEYTQIAEVTTDVGGEQILISSEGLIRDVQIQYGTWDESGTEFTVKATIFSTYTLSPGDGIMLETFIPDTLPNLRITYRSGSEQITQYISQSGKDGSIILLDP